MTNRDKPTLRAEYTQKMLEIAKNWGADEYLSDGMRTLESDIDDLLAQVEAKAVESTLKKVYCMIKQNGSFERSQLIHKLARIIQGEEKL